MNRPASWSSIAMKVRSTIASISLRPRSLPGSMLWPMTGIVSCVTERRAVVVVQLVERVIGDAAGDEASVVPLEATAARVRGDRRAPCSRP